MRDFVRVATACPKGRVADPEYNLEQMLILARKAEEENVSLLVYPELCLTSYTAMDMIYQRSLLEAGEKALISFCEQTKEMDVLFVIGYGLLLEGKLFNTGVVTYHGDILGIVPKQFIPNHAEFYERRYFQEGKEEVRFIPNILKGEGYRKEIPFGASLHFVREEDQRFRLAVEICEDLWVPVPPSSKHALAGATLLANCSASDELVGKRGSRRRLLEHYSGNLHASYLYSSAGPSESTQDMVFSAHCLISENGRILKENQPFEEGIFWADVNLALLEGERMRQSTYFVKEEPSYTQYFSMKDKQYTLHRFVSPCPFLPKAVEKEGDRAREILSIQSRGLKKRMEHVGCKKLILGLSGGLDSTLALFVCLETFALLGYDKENILCITMPSFGTSKKTHDSAEKLAKALGISLREISIEKAVLQHFSDIGHDGEKKDIVYENAQARERTQILMDLANKEGALLVGTGDLSELALGFATYNGDHMSMYGVNGDIPKTAIPMLLREFAGKSGNQELETVVEEIIATPVSPELLPPDATGEISQRTEDVVGPYLLQDFFLYQHLRYGFSARNIYDLACFAFSKENLANKENERNIPEFSPAEILKNLKTFYKRFFGNQFKRSCLPDGPKVGRVALSPRGDLRMASDACAEAWLSELSELEA